MGTDSGVRPTIGPRATQGLDQLVAEIPRKL